MNKFLNQWKIEEQVFNHFMQLYQDENVDREEALNELLVNIPQIVFQELNKDYYKCVAMEELKMVVFSVSIDKAPQTWWV